MVSKIFKLFVYFLVLTLMLFPRVYASFDDSKKLEIVSNTKLSFNNTESTTINEEEFQRENEYIEFERMLGGKKIKREIIEDRGMNEKHFELEDGTLVSVISSENLHFINESGAMKSIDPTISLKRQESSHNIITNPVLKNDSDDEEVQSENGKGENYTSNEATMAFETAAMPFDLDIPYNFIDGYSIGSDSSLLKFIPVNANPSIGQINNLDLTKVRYQDVWESTDVELEIKKWGIKENLILKDINAPTKFSYEVIGVLNDELDGNKVKLLPAWLQDATGVIEEVEQKLRIEEGKQYLDLYIDATSLTYPILVDPSGYYEQEEEFQNQFYSFAVNLDPAESVRSTDIYIVPYVPLYNFHLTAGTMEISVPEIKEEYHHRGGENSLSLPDNNIVDFSFDKGHRSRGAIYILVTYSSAPIQVKYEYIYENGRLKYILNPQNGFALRTYYYDANGNLIKVT